MKRKVKDLKENQSNPQELENGNYAIEKPEEEFLTGIDAPVETNVKIKLDETVARLPDPKGTPTVRP